MGKVEQSFNGRCLICQASVVMRRCKPENAGDYEWRGRCNGGGHPLRLISPKEADGEMAIELEEEE